MKVGYSRFGSHYDPLQQKQRQQHRQVRERRISLCLCEHRNRPIYCSNGVALIIFCPCGINTRQPSARCGFRASPAHEMVHCLEWRRVLAAVEKNSRRHVRAMFHSPGRWVCDHFAADGSHFASQLNPCYSACADSKHHTKSYPWLLSLISRSQSLT